MSTNARPQHTIKILGGDLRIAHELVQRILRSGWDSLPHDWRSSVVDGEIPFITSVVGVALRTMLRETLAQKGGKR